MPDAVQEFRETKRKLETYDALADALVAVRDYDAGWDVLSDELKTQIREACAKAGRE